MSRPYEVLFIKLELDFLKKAGLEWWGWIQNKSLRHQDQLNCDLGTPPHGLVHRVHRVATAAFWCTFSHEGKTRPGWWGWGVHASPPPLSLHLPSPVKLQLIRSSWVGRRTNPVTSLVKYVLCGLVPVTTCQPLFLATLIDRDRALQGAGSKISTCKYDTKTTFKNVADKGVTKRCCLSWLTNSALAYEPKCGGRGRVAGSQPMSTAVHRSLNKLWRSNSIFNLCRCTAYCEIYITVAASDVQFF